MIFLFGGGGDAGGRLSSFQSLAAIPALRYVRYADREMQEAIVSSDKIG
jgi:hypothetical protein